MYEHYRGLEVGLPVRSAERPRVLVLPTQEFFPMRPTHDHAFATAVFEQTRALMDMAAWNCVLTPQSDENCQMRDAVLRSGVFGETATAGAAGTFRAGREVEITYAPALLRDPIGLVATLAHELCHCLLATVESVPPAGWSQLEPLTDLSAVVEGFGVFMCNNAFSFEQWSDGQYQGWQGERRGYLTAAELGFALAVFCVRTGASADAADRVLKPNPREVFRDALAYVQELERAV